MKIKKSITELVGKTPLLEISGFMRETGAKARLLAKLEYLNPAGSVKDRVALAMIEAAEKSGALKRGGTVIEPTSGNTGIGLAAVCAARGYKLIATMPETMSAERISILAAYGAEIVLTSGDEGMRGAIEKAKELREKTENSIIAGQFDNPANPAAHRKTTGPEIYRDTNGEVDIFVSAVGTGGTISGVGNYLKSKNPNVKIIAVEPATSPVLSGGNAGAHGIQGIGAGFVPNTLDTEVYDEVIAVSDADAFASAKLLGKTDGVLVGISSGAALCAAVKLAKRKENENKTIVVLLPDSADRYYSTALFN
ncbi:MAG: cysteine synthase A [Clostridia bacterium]|nr:cysteine synthase A [Clostridia bacterium]